MLFPKSARVRTRLEYLYIARRAMRRSGSLFFIEYAPNRSLGTRLGITVSRRYGNAVKRNRFKRVVREAFRQCRETLPPGVDIHVKPRGSFVKMTTSDVIGELLSLMSKCSFV